MEELKRAPQMTKLINSFTNISKLNNDMIYLKSTDSNLHFKLGLLAKFRVKNTQKTV